MVRAILLAACSLATVAFAQTTGKPVCGDGIGKCGSDSPCCSTYGQCGVGAYCLGGCDPRGSFNLQSCMPAPICKSQDYKLTSLDDVAKNTEYLGDASTANWVSSGTPVAYQDNSLLLTMAQSTSGTLLTSTHYVWYGKVSATFTTSQGAGVVTAFILMSDVHDEIDFEFVGVDTGAAQSNYYYQGVTDYHNEMNLTVSDTATTTHTYEIDWSPTSITWSIDGKVMRTLNQKDTYNTTDKQYHYPQTPARVQLSLWPAGLSTNGQGTIDWAGGLVDWNSQYMQNGYYYARFTDVNVQCYDPPSGYKNNGNNAYEYTGVPGTQNQVETTNDNTILGSLIATGNDQKAGAKPAGSGTSSASAQESTIAANSVPGAVAGTAGTGADPLGGTSSKSSDGSSGGSSSSSSGSGSGFSQGGDGNTSDASSRVAGSLVALISVCVAAMML